MAVRKSITWTKIFARSFAAMSRSTLRTSARVIGEAIEPTVKRLRPPPGTGQWIAGVAMGSTGMRRFQLYRPPGVMVGERLPLMVMLHGCLQDAKSFATSTRMNGVAARERFLVLYPEQDRVSNAQGCWNWFDTTAGRAYGEASLIMKAVDQVCLMYPVDRSRVAVAGLSAGASMAALLAAKHPERFKAVVMHSGIPPGTAHSSLTVLGAMQGRRATKPLIATRGAKAMSWPPLMVIHGGSDRVVAFSNGQAAVQRWAEAAGATTVRERTVQRGRRYSTNVTDYKRSSSTVATLVEIAKLGHAWSGGSSKQPYTDARGPDASRMTWAFAARQFRTRRAD
ncbi:PHB depolymerase family esterase [Variovorax sp. J31P207]|uniref:extracellular catalytic domain type 1 short-chain-length polyhydroxyalkanoate depolymerase n=1 Tax=Variovorax sp. J31P207 TaxID=3053510 RepID=UPI0025750910|nr:PHB depolymerase family esterase [Variovorax sp. J31P207]MDM0065255.1 PHB depolymerase family esterase [Variovorax sp. J31P207]